MTTNIRTIIVPSAAVMAQFEAVFAVDVNVEVDASYTGSWGVAPPSPDAPVNVVIARTDTTHFSVGWDYIGTPVLQDGWEFSIDVDVDGTDRGATTVTTIAPAQQGAPSGSTYGTVIGGVTDSDTIQVFVTLIVGSSPNTSSSKASPSNVLPGLQQAAVRQQTVGLTRLYGTPDGDVMQSLVFPVPLEPGNVVVIPWACKRTSTAPIVPLPDPYAVRPASSNLAHLTTPTVPINVFDPAAAALLARLRRVRGPYPNLPNYYGVPTFAGPFDLDQAVNFIPANASPAGDYVQVGIFVAPVLSQEEMAAYQYDKSTVHSIVRSQAAYSIMDMGTVEAYEIVTPAAPTVKKALTSQQGPGQAFGSGGLAVTGAQVYAAVLAVNGDNPIYPYAIPMPVPSTDMARWPVLFADDIATTQFGDMLIYFGIYVRDPSESGTVTPQFSVSFPDRSRTMGLAQAVVI